LTGIEFDVISRDNEKIAVKTPSFRVDVSRPQDLMEEVARCHGYKKIPVTFPPMPTDRPPVAKMLDQRQHVRSAMTGLGFTEVINYSFTHADSVDRLNLLPDDERRNMVAILNPLTEDQSVMRTSMIPGILETVQRNVSRQSRTLKLFEIGHVFLARKDRQLPDEIEILAGCWTGNRSTVSWHTKPAACDFFDLKGALEGLLKWFKVPGLQFSRLPKDQCRYTRAGASALISSNGTVLGAIGEIHPQILDAYHLKQAVFVFEIRMDALIAVTPDTIEARPLPKFPSTSRDATLIVDGDIESGHILDMVRQMDEPLVEDIRMFDLFEGDPIPQGRKSVSLRVTYRSSEATLEDDAVNRLHKQISDHLVARFNADLPA
jgi:phenylalanyl-tRNA synthetase beta chain